jgi:hypothetical protein
LNPPKSFELIATLVAYPKNCFGSMDLSFELIAALVAYPKNLASEA